MNIVNILLYTIIFTGLTVYLILLLYGLVKLFRFLRPRKKYKIMFLRTNPKEDENLWETSDINYEKPDKKVIH